MPLPWPRQTFVQRKVTVCASHEYHTRSVSKRHWICWKRGLAKVPWQTSGTQIYCLFSLRTCWHSCPVVVGQHLSSCPYLAFQRMWPFLWGGIIFPWNQRLSLSQGLEKFSPRFRYLCDLPQFPKLRDFLIYFQIQCRMCWQRTTWEGSLLPLISAGCILPHVQPLPFFKLMHRQ